MDTRSGMEDRYTFIELLVMFRVRAGLTQAQLAEKRGVNRNTIVAWENGRHPPKSRNAVLDLADALELDEADTDRLLFAFNYRLEHGTPEEMLRRLPRMDAQLAAIEQKLDRIANGVRIISEREGQTRAIPLQRPPRPEHFTGRNEPLAWLLAELQPGRRVTLCGPGGIGKTALAAEAIWTLAPGDDPPPGFPDGIVFHTFYHQPQASLALEAIARAYGEIVRPNPAEAARRALAGRRTLLVLDGTEAADDLESVLQVAASCGVLITTRRHADAPAGWLDVLPLAPDEAVRLLQAWSGDCAADSASAQRIAELLGGLPLALFLAGRYLAHSRQRAADYLIWLEGTPLAALNFADRPSRSFPLLMAHSLTRVSESARVAIGVAGLLALEPFDRDPVISALEISVVEADRALGELVDHGLLVRPGDGYRITHALAHTYARQEISPEGTILARLAEHYVALTKVQSELGPPGYRVLDSHRAHILAVQAACLAAGQWEAVRSITQATETYLDLHGLWTERVTLLQQGLAGARGAGNQPDESALLGRLGLVSADLGDLRQAIRYHEAALTIHREIRAASAQGSPDWIAARRGEGNRLGSLGLAYHSVGDLRQAIPHYEEALAISREIGHRRNEGVWLGNLGAAHYGLGDVQRAIEYYQGALEIHREMGAESAQGSQDWMAARRGEGNTLGNLGLATAALGEARRAIGYYEEQLVIVREIGDRRGEGNAVGDLGLAYASLGQTQQSVGYFEQALAIHRAIGDRRGEGNWLGNLGRAYAELEDGQTAIKFCEQSLIIKRETADRPGEGEALHFLGYAHYVAGNSALALQLHQAGIGILRETGHKRPLERTLIDLAEVYLAANDLNQAEECYREALGIAQDIGDRRGEGSALKGLGSTLRRQGYPKEARQAWTQALQIFEEIESPLAATVRTWLAV